MESYIAVLDLNIGYLKILQRTLIFIPVWKKSMKTSIEITTFGYGFLSD